MMESLVTLEYHCDLELKLMVNLALGSQPALVYSGSLDLDQMAGLLDS